MPAFAAQCRQSRAGSSARRAFSIIELMVALALLLAVATLVVPSLSGIAARSRADEAAAQLDAWFQQARSDARKRGAPVRIEMRPSTRGGYEVWFVPELPGATETGAAEAGGDGPAWYRTETAASTSGPVYTTGSGDADSRPMDTAGAPAHQVGILEPRIDLRQVDVSRDAGIEESPSAIARPQTSIGGVPGLRREIPDYSAAPDSASAMASTPREPRVLAWAMPDGTFAGGTPLTLSVSDEPAFAIEVSPWTGLLTLTRLSSAESDGSSGLDPETRDDEPAADDTTSRSAARAASRPGTARTGDGTRRTTPSSGDPDREPKGPVPRP